eukprot:SAG25_NODE_2025_length_2014_cov_1.644386_1_plen_89_part_00
MLRSLYIKSSNATLATTCLLLELLPLLIYSSSSLIPACVESEVVPLALMFHACTPLLADFGDADFLGKVTGSCRGIAVGSDAGSTDLS